MMSQMLAAASPPGGSNQNIIQMCNFEANKSTKGASKLRRDLINAEIANLRDLLPLPSSTRQRLSQLQLMALVCVFVRKTNYFRESLAIPFVLQLAEAEICCQLVVGATYDQLKQRSRLTIVLKEFNDYANEIPMPQFGFSKALSGFLIMLTQNGKLLYISDNAAEYLGHSMEDLLIHGDSVYDIIEKQDHANIQAELSRNPIPSETRTFLCRMNVSRNARRQMRFGDQKVVLVQGHFVGYLPLCSRNEPVFLATCTPVAMPETRECVVQGSTLVFTSIHSMDMKFLHLDAIGDYHLGYQRNSLHGLSWYEFVHWEHLTEAQSKHKLITQNEQERSCILLLRLQTLSQGWLWIHCVLQVKESSSSDSSQQSVIVCTNQVLSEQEAYVMRQNSWLYQYYSLHSKMSYNLGYNDPSMQPASPPSHQRSSQYSPVPYSSPSPGLPTPHYSSVNAYPPPSHTVPAPTQVPKWTPQVIQGAGIKRSISPDEDKIMPKIPAFAHPHPHSHGHTIVSHPQQPIPHYPQPIMHSGVPQFTELTPPSSGGTGGGYLYGSLALATAATAPVFRQSSKYQLDEEAAALADVEQSLTPTNTDEVSHLISAANYLRTVPRPTYIEPMDPYHFSLAYPTYSELALQFPCTSEYHRSFMPPPTSPPPLLQDRLESTRDVLS